MVQVHIVTANIPMVNTQISISRLIFAVKSQPQNPRPTMNKPIKKKKKKKEYRAR